MIFNETRLSGAYLIGLEKKEDDRGFFARSFCRQEFESHGLNPDVVQTNIGFSQSKGTLRGLHYQTPPHAEAKLVRCTSGALYDVILDLRPESFTFKQWLGVELHGSNYQMLYVPEGFAHGYLTLTDCTEVLYQVSQFYTPGAEQGIRWNDSAFQIVWPEMEKLEISRKDQSWPDWPD
jgi:dTDP-4-dehydrorhamnose 3,5-epimerase